MRALSVSVNGKTAVAFSEMSVVELEFKVIILKNEI
jgi:hypothetical protein